MDKYEKQGCPGVLFVTYDDASLELKFCEKIKLQVVFHPEKSFQNDSDLQSCSKISSCIAKNGCLEQDGVETHFEAMEGEMNRWNMHSRNVTVVEREESLSSGKQLLNDDVLQKRNEVYTSCRQLAESPNDLGNHTNANVSLSQENEDLPIPVIKNELCENGVNVIMSTDELRFSSESKSERGQEENYVDTLRRHGEHPRRHNCDLCRRCFSSVHEYLQHTKTGAKNVKCSSCGMVFPSVAAYLIHNQLQHGSSAESEVNVNADQNNLASVYHGSLTEERHHQYLVCPVCKLTLIGHALLAHIMTAHTQEGNYKCCVCNYLAMSPGALDSHKMKHIDMSKNERLKLLSKAATLGLNQMNNKEESSKHSLRRRMGLKLCHCENSLMCHAEHKSTASRDNRENTHACTFSKMPVVTSSPFSSEACELLETNFHVKKNVKEKGKNKKLESPVGPVVSSVHSSSNLCVSEARNGFSLDYEEVRDCNRNAGSDVIMIPGELSAGERLDNSGVDDKDLNDGKDNSEVCCKYCKVKFSSHCDYQNHRRTKKHQHNCDHCAEVLSSRAHLILHKKMMHNEEGKILNIDKENVKGDVLRRLQNEIFSTNKKESKAKKRLGVSKGANQVACPFCGWRLATKCLLVHVMSTHTKEGYYKCCVCDQQEISLTKWKKHCEFHYAKSKKGMVTCKICNETFKDRTEFSVHSAEHHNKICYFCKESFPVRYLLTEHYSSAHLSQMKKCDECGKLFARDSSLKQHKKDHKRSLRQCNKCGIICKALSHHMKRMHPPADKELFSCPTCSKTFSRKESLNRHLLTHDKGNHFTCHLCGKSLKTVTSLSRHIKCHEQVKPFVCQVCGKQSMRKSNLRTHMRVHAEEKKFHCTFCGKGFNYKASVLGHMKSKHNAEFEAVDQAFTVSNVPEVSL